MDKNTKNIKKHDVDFLSVKNIDSNTNKKNTNNIALKISIFNIVCSFFLFIIKDVASIIGNSDSLRADSFHSLSDVFVSIIVFIGIKISNKPTDDKLPYGYDRIECVASIILSFILFYVGATIGYSSITDIIMGDFDKITVPNLFALTTNIISIVIKLLMFAVTLFIAKKTNYGTLRADAYHHLTDVFASIGVFFGITGSMLGINFADKIASIVICFVILKLSIEIFIDSAKKMIDYSAPEMIKTEINNIINNVINTENINVSFVKTRLFGNKIYILIELIPSKKMQYEDYYIISQKIKNEINSNINNVKNCIITYNFTEKTV